MSIITLHSYFQIHEQAEPAREHELQSVEQVVNSIGSVLASFEVTR